MKLNKMGLVKTDKTLLMQLRLQEERKEREEKEKNEKKINRTRPFWNSSWQK
jgi:hypothetical protein